MRVVLGFSKNNSRGSAGPELLGHGSLQKTYKTSDHYKETILFTICPYEL